MVPLVRNSGFAMGGLDCQIQATFSFLLRQGENLLLDLSIHREPPEET